MEEQPDRSDERSEDSLAQEETDAAASEAARVGGPAPDYQGDEERRAVEEGGGGEAEGFEQAEEELVEEASHAESRHSPEEEAFPPEPEADPPAGTYGEPDQVEPAD